MTVSLRFITLLTISFFSVILSWSQDAPAKYEWNVTSKKVADNRYELIFSTAGVSGWQLYEPGQVFDGTR